MYVWHILPPSPPNIIVVNLKVLTFIFYKPVSKVIDERETYISGNLTQASEKLIKADELYSQYDEQLKTAKVNAQAIIAKAEKEAKAKTKKKEVIFVFSILRSTR